MVLKFFFPKRAKKVVIVNFFLLFLRFRKVWKIKTKNLLLVKC